MKACLVGNHFVEIAPECLHFGGSWEGGQKRKGYPLAYGQDSLEYVYDFFVTKQGGLLIDVGASTGSFSLLPTVLPDYTEVHAFEPYDEAYSLLLQNICLSRKLSNGRVTLHRCALGGDYGVGTLRIPHNIGVAGLSNLGDGSRIEGLYEMVKVPIVPLDAYNLAPDFIKIDTEGYEISVLGGALGTINKWRPTILMEFEQRNLVQHNMTEEYVMTWLEHNLAGYVFTRFGEIDLLCEPV